VSTYGGGLSVINTQGTLDPLDDTLVTRYHTGSTPALGHNLVYHTFLQGTLLYVGTLGGLSVINTQGTLDPLDDTLVTRYYTGSVPALGDNGVRHTSLEDTLLYASTNGGLSVFNTDGAYNDSSLYNSTSNRITDVPTTTLTYTATKTSDHTTSLQYRTGASDAAYFNDFTDGTTTEYLGDFYGWGGAFQTAEESSGTIKLSNPQPGWSNATTEGTDSIIDTGKPDGYFPLGSKVTVRYKMNTTATNTGGCIYNDDWWDDDGCPSITPNQWTTTSFDINFKTFSKIGFEMWWSPGTWSPTDTFEIDWLKIETPDSFDQWNDWSTPCTDTTCAIDPTTLVGNEWIQYKLNLETTNLATTPLVHSVSYTNGYQSTGTYTSPITTFEGTKVLNTFNVTQVLPASTTSSYEYTLDSGTTWHPITPGATFPSGTTATSFAWRTTLVTTNATVTPIITSVVLTTTNPPKQTGTSVATQIEHLTKNGNTDKAALLAEKYGNGTSNGSQPTHIEVQREIIGILEETVFILRRLIEIREGV
jgi:hypothetical protein